MNAERCNFYGLAADPHPKKRAHVHYSKVENFSDFSEDACREQLATLF